MKLISALKLVDPQIENLHVVTEKEKKELQNMLLEMMKDISSICEENKIEWSLSGGSVLGAVRHHGFIPWDDDMDINMSRSEFEKFRKVFPGRFSDRYQLIVPGDNDYLFHTPIIMRKNTTFRGLMSTEVGIHGVFIDVFVMENVSDNKIKYIFHGVECTLLYALQSMVRTYKCKTTLMEHTTHYPNIQKSIKFRSFFGHLLSIIPLENWSKAVFKCYSKNRNTDSRYISIPSGCNHFFGETYEREKVCTFVKCQFESELFPIPKDWDYYLRKLYGDSYMTPPPPKERMEHVVVEFDLHN